MEATTKQVEGTSQGVESVLEITPHTDSPLNDTKKVESKMAVEDQRSDAVADPPSDKPADQSNECSKEEPNSSEGEDNSKHQNGVTNNKAADTEGNVKNENSQSECDGVTQTENKNDECMNKSEDKSVQTSAETVAGKKSKKKDNKSEEKKLVDLLVHVFDGLDTPEKKMEALAKKYIQLAADMKTTETKLEDVESKHREVKKEKEQMQADYGKVNMAKTKLESLCRELQKQNKIIKEEIQRRADEEDRKRRELSQKFQTTINDITTQMGENHKRNQQLKQDNTDLAQKLKGLVEQYEVREQHIEKVLKAKQLELQLCEAKLQQQSLTSQEERQNNLKEKHVLLQESLDQKKKVEMLVKQEAELKSQLALYTEKFVEFQSTLTKSNEVFATFRKEMDKMTKTIRKLEKESNMWKTRYENTNISLVHMVEERTQKDNEIISQKGKIDKLEKLCRALQSERRKLKKELEEFEKDKKSTDQTPPESLLCPEQSANSEKADENLSPPSSPSLENGAPGKEEGRELSMSQSRTGLQTDSQPHNGEACGTDEKPGQQSASNDKSIGNCNEADSSAQNAIAPSNPSDDSNADKASDQTDNCSNNNDN